MMVKGDISNFQKSFKDTIAVVVNNVKDNKTARVKSVGKKAKFSTANASNAILNHFLGVNVEDQVDPSEYRIEPDEINELFRVS